ncbi:TPA: hypothetical protein JAJ60_000869 [Corynebacterium striatum]|nr:hypothetical protein [Corynebacterium striatum]HAT1167739.1 hypothetical protein [Corynebacterium striatum]HAT1173404.1 hypothetical protein [Corynebacterium striatum]HAT1198677.1 hypothetical protein [Corynebacterium striatum]HAT1201001.1 hypothetical protein [Corynebacterium striatum]
MPQVSDVDPVVVIHGTTLNGIGPTLNKLPDTAPGVKYTSIYSPADTTGMPLDQIMWGLTR